ncbi:MAG: DUF4870 domain-containing protein [bacterium]
MAEEKVVEAKPVAAANNDLLMKAVVMYLLAPFGGLFFMNDTDSFVKFNAKQSLYYGIALIIAYVLSSVLSMFLCGIPTLIVMVGQIVLVIYMIVKVKDGVKVKLPVIGDMAEK